MNRLIVGDFREQKLDPASVSITDHDWISLMIADPVYETDMVNDVISLGKTLNIPSIVFCSVEDMYSLRYKPDQTCFWFKPYSTKNTSKRYSNFVEPILMYGVSFHKMLHWSSRIGIFQDTIIDNTQHEWKKPESLIEKLILSHYCGQGIVLDPCAGSGTVHNVCKRLGIPSLSIEKDPKYQGYYQ